MGRDYTSLTVAELTELRSLVLDRIALVPAFRRGSLQVGDRKCGRASCRCARPGEPGHGPRGLWTRTANGRSRGQYVPVEQVDQVRAELDSYAEFAALVADYVDINEALCTVQLRPGSTPTRRKPATEIVDPAGPGGEKGGPTASRRS